MRFTLNLEHILSEYNTSKTLATTKLPLKQLVTILLFTPKSLQSHSHSVSDNNSHNAACFSPNLHSFQQKDSPQKQRGIGFGSQPSRPQYNRVLLCTRLSKVLKNGSPFITLCCFFPNSFTQIVCCRIMGFL